MSAQTFATSSQQSARTAAAVLPALEDAAPSNSEQLLALGSELLSPVTSAISDVMGWMMGTDAAAATTDGAASDTAIAETVAACQTTDGITPPDLVSVEGLTSADVRTGYANDPRAQTALDALTNDPNFAKLSAEQQGGLLQRFQEAPNAATTQYLQGLAAYHTSDDQCGAGLTAFEDGLKADAGTFSADGVTYSISNGQLLDADGVVAGDIRTDGSYKLNTQTDRQSYYDDIHTRVKMTEGEGKDTKTLLDLHDADPANKLTDDGINDTFAGKATDTLKDLRHEGLDMRVDSGYRSFTEQDGLYAKGRTKPGSKVTNARGGESWHNYGVAADIVFNDANGRSSWPDGGEYTKLWSRYGEIGQDNGLEWGGSWTSIKDRPHIEYHPGLTASDASTLKDEHRSGGLEAAWDAMGIGEQEDPPNQRR